MEISFSKQQLKKLVEIAAIAEWVLTALDEEDDPRKDEYMKVLQKIYRSGYQNGMKEEIEHLEDVDEFFPTTDWEEGTEARTFIEEFEEKSFWTELINRLTERDLKIKLQGKEPKNFDEYYEKFEAISEKYVEEFKNNDLENISIIKK